MYSYYIMHITNIYACMYAYVCVCTHACVYTCAYINTCTVWKYTDVCSDVYHQLFLYHISPLLISVISLIKIYAFNKPITGCLL